MRFMKAVIVGSIIGLVAYYIFRKRDEERWSAADSAQGKQRDAIDRLDIADAPADTVSSEQERLEAAAVAPEPITAPDSPETLSLSNMPHTPSLFQDPDRTEQPANRVLEVEEDLDVSEQDNDTGNPIVTLFDSRSQVEPPQHPGHRVQTGEYYPSARNPLPKAMLRCRDNGGEWTLFLEVPDEREVVKACRGDEQLVGGKEIEIRQFTGQVVVDYEDGGQDKLGLYELTPLYFRTNDGWEQDGRLVANLANGYFIAIAPTEMDDEFAASEHDPEDCADPGFHAHFLAIGKEYESETYGKYPATLAGNKIYDAADVDFHGELYVGQPPELSVHEMVTDARIVEETDSMRENRWGKNFDPHAQTIASVLDERDGRFTVRTYLKGSRRRHESKTFRYFKSVERITLDGEIYDPDMILTPDENNKYFDAQLRFEGLNGLIKPASVDSPSASIADDGLLTVPADPSIKQITCEFTNRASIVIDIPRIWWRLVDDHSRGEWNNIRPIKIDDYKRIARKDARIEMLLPHSVNTILVGFGETLEHSMRKVQSSATIRLLDFADDATLENLYPGNSTHLSVRINELVLRLMEIGVPQAKKPLSPDTRELMSQPARWVELERGSPGEICRSSEGHWWKDYESEPGHPTRPIINEDGQEIRNCRRCGASERREG